MTGRIRCKNLMVLSPCVPAGTAAAQRVDYVPSPQLSQKVCEPAGNEADLEKHQKHPVESGREPRG